jgi:hypothetical protein
MGNDQLKELIRITSNGITQNVIIVCVGAVVVSLFIGGPNIPIILMFATSLLVLFKSTVNYVRITELLYDQ